MRLSIEMPSELERRLRDAARRLATDPEELACRLLDEQLPPAITDRTPSLFPDGPESGQRDARPSAA